MQYRRQSAFSLLEIMIALGILGILIGVAYPNYLAYMKKGYWAEAQQNIEAINQAQEQFYLENNTYFFDNSDNNAALAAASGGLWNAEGTVDGEVKFTYTVVPAGGGYTVTATANPGSPVAGKSVSETH